MFRRAVFFETAKINKGGEVGGGGQFSIGIHVGLFLRLVYSEFGIKSAASTVKRKKNCMIGRSLCKYIDSNISSMLQLKSETDTTSFLHIIYILPHV